MYTYIYIYIHTHMYIRIAYDIFSPHLDHGPDLQGGVPGTAEDLGKIVISYIIYELVFK